MAKPATTGSSRKALKTAGIVLASLMGFLLVVLVALYFLAEPLVVRYIKKQVAYQTNELYQIDLSDLQLHFRTRSIALKGLHFYPDTTVNNQLKENSLASPSLFDIRVPRLEIRNVNLIDLIFNNQLNMNTVVAERPEITQLLNKSVQRNRKYRSKGGAMDAVRIRQLEVQDASYRYLAQGLQSRPKHQIHHLSLQVQGVQLNLEKQQDITEMLQADEVELRLNSYTYLSPDSVYSVRLGRLSYSYRQQVLKAVDLEVQPDIKANSTLSKDLAHQVVYQLHAHKLHIKGLDIGETWRTKQLHLDQLMLNRTALHLTEDLNVPDAASFPGLAELYAELSPYLREVGIKELRLTDGSFSYGQKNGGFHTVHNLDKANIYLQALQLDSATLFTPKEKSFAAAIRATAKNYTYSPRYSPYTTKVGSMKLSTRDKTLQVDALRLSGDWDKNNKLKSLNTAKRTFYNISLPHLRFGDISLLQALQTSHLAIGSITAVQPVIDIRTDQLVKMQDTGPGLQELYRQVSGFINKLEVGEINITDASLTQHSKNRAIHLLQQLDHASLKAIGLVVDSAFIFNPDKKLPLQDMVVTARNYRYQMPDNTYIFALADLRYSTRQKEFSARSVDVISSIRENDRQKLYENASRSLYDLSANTLQVTGLNLVKAFNTGRLEADHLLLRQPDVAILLDRKVAVSESGKQGAGEGLFKYLDIVSVKTVRLEDGSFTFNEKLEPVMRTHLLEHATATITGFQLTSASFANLSQALPMEEMTLLAKNYTYRTTDSLYTIRLDSLHYSSRQQEVVAHTFTVSADREVNERLKAEHPELASRNLIDISSERSRITGFNLIHAYATGQYHMIKLLLSGPRVTILQDHSVNLSNDKVSVWQDTKTTSESMQQLTDRETTFRVERLEIDDGTFDFHILEDTIRISQTLEHVALEIDQFRLVSLESSDPLEIFDVDDVSIQVRGYTFFTRDSLYALEVKAMRASMSNRSLSVDSLRLRPLYSKEQYASLFRYARDRIDLTVPDIELQGISLRALFNNQDIVAHNMLIQNPVVEIYRDNRLGIDPDLRPPTLQSALRGAGVYIKLDTIRVEKNYFIHPVIAIDGIKPAEFVLDNIRMQAYNITNDTALIRRNNMLTVNASALFMGVSSLKAHFQFQLDHPEDRYTYEGTLEPMDFKALNPLLENLVFIRIKSGQIHKATFKIEATGNEATGQVHFPYNDLKVQLLNKHDPDNPGLVLKAGTRLINIFIIKSNNPSAWGKFRVGDVEEERDPKRSVSYHISQSMLDGVTSSLMTKLVYQIVSRFVEL
ncbi:hypothetical protein ABID22_002162 [Pontibacter aydingkolensis]|uniref:AsmA family protein n=1 Tax=Pontibacter aydingkolensis TaxID=1911536 RepID=A0ABS7CV84_9BACT|nr:hypothetical protein [Pontibacter aydingkolensis]MBW7467774.1 hypothetical protein [Pontibacter aydingkolensis]